jgi:CheY-like chemotaxis protein
MRAWSTVYGITRIRNCCLFRWFEREGQPPRTVEIRPEHCKECVTELRAIAAERGIRLVERGSLNKAILIVEDEIDIRLAVASVLEEEGYLVYSASNGKEALELLKQIPRPALVLVDLMMPVMSGWQLIESLQGDDVLATLPVAVVTAADVTTVDGAKRVMRKPIQIEKLIALVEELSGPPPPMSPTSDQRVA